MKVKLEFQYFEGCPNHKKLSDNLQEAIKGLEDKIELKKVLVEVEEKAKQIGFRGSPTLLIDGEDIEGIPAPVDPNPSCRFYSNGIPKADEIRKMIIHKISKEK